MRDLFKGKHARSNSESVDRGLLDKTVDSLDEAAFHAASLDSSRELTG
jgi:hypothetical protein